MQINTSSQQPQLPPGFRFHPTDEELVVHYLQKKESNDPLPVAIIAEVDLYKHDPWELPAMATFGEHEWYFFSMREKKYPNGGRPNRTATSGYWKATGTDKPVLTAGGTQKIGVKKALVFYGGKPPKGVKTNWIMHEYRLITGRGSGSKPPVVDDTAKNKTSLRLDDWVLCRIYKKSNTQRAVEVDGGRDVVMAMNGGILASQPPCRLFNNNNNNNNQQQQGFMNHEQNNVLFDNMLNSKSSGNELLPSTACTKMFLMDTSSMAATQHTGNNHEYQLPDMNWYSN
ncbi:hypothetical protein QVD17_27200 [Tagetes erecta]|uniref:NAC domain-containing protein n=1 Tax=Tagetes erecta TaxID=13708 RepID=A0AAD8KCP3_TARER|nr:hypothetical protein QVD17_27200 [Tagetes erecta]